MVHLSFGAEFSQEIAKGWCHCSRPPPGQGRAITVGISEMQQESAGSEGLATEEKVGGSFSQWPLSSLVASISSASD